VDVVADISGEFCSVSVDQANRDYGPPPPIPPPPAMDAYSLHRGSVLFADTIYCMCEVLFISVFCRFVSAVAYLVISAVSSVCCVESVIICCCSLFSIPACHRFHSCGPL